MAKTCFVITPIGAVDSEERAHADRIWKVVLEPVFEVSYKLVRSDKMDDPGQITDAIFKRIAESEVCIADLSFLNPNVMYELGVRHCLRLPTIQIKQEGTRNPFDTQNQRTIDFDLASDESLVALTAEIQKQLTWIERNPGIVSNPLTNVIDRQQRGSESEQIFREMAALSRRLLELEARLSESSKLGTGIDEAEDVVGEDPIEALKTATEKDLEHDGVGWKENKDGSLSAQFAGFDIALRQQSKGRWSSGAIHTLSGYSVTYPPWQASQELARKAIFAKIVDEADIWRQA